MEKQLFDYDDYDEVGISAYNFYSVVTKVPIGDIAIGTKFSSAFVDYANGILAFYDEADEPRERVSPIFRVELYKFKIGLTVLMDVVE